MSTESAIKKLTGHGKVLCSKCDKVIITCKCMDCNKNIFYDICDDCENKTDKEEV